MEATEAASRVVGSLCDDQGDNSGNEERESQGPRSRDGSHDRQEHEDQDDGPSDPGAHPRSAHFVEQLAVLGTAFGVAEEPQVLEVRVGLAVGHLAPRPRCEEVLRQLGNGREPADLA